MLTGTNKYPIAMLPPEEPEPKARPVAAPSSYRRKVDRSAGGRVEVPVDVGVGAEDGVGSAMRWERRWASEAPIGAQLGAAPWAVRRPLSASALERLEPWGHLLRNWRRGQRPRVGACPHGVWRGPPGAGACKSARRAGTWFIEAGLPGNSSGFHGTNASGRACSRQSRPRRALNPFPARFLQ